jgi:hypothetical protein
MVKMPSWWVKSAQVRLDFGEVGGMWMHTGTEATADVRVFGPHTLTENALRVRTGSTVAELASPPRSAAGRHFHPQAVLGTIEH